MMTAQGEIKRVINGYTAFARVNICQDNKKPEGIIEVACHLTAPACWQAAAAAGIAFALRQISGWQPIIVTKITGTAVDTNPTHVLVAAARAVWNLARQEEDWSAYSALFEPKITEADLHLMGLVAKAHKDPKKYTYAVPVI